MNSLGGEGAQDAPHPCWLQIASCVQIVRALARGSAYREIHVAQPSVAVRVLLARAAKSTDGACRWRHRGQHQHRGNQRLAVSTHGRHAWCVRWIVQRLWTNNFTTRVQITWAFRNSDSKLLITFKPKEIKRRTLLVPADFWNLGPWITRPSSAVICRYIGNPLGGAARNKILFQYKL
jgi:hypothetical protein